MNRCISGTTRTKHRTTVRCFLDGSNGPSKAMSAQSSKNSRLGRSSHETQDVLQRLAYVDDQDNRWTSPYWAFPSTEGRTQEMAHGSTKTFKKEFNISPGVVCYSSWDLCMTYDFSVRSAAMDHVRMKVYLLLDVLAVARARSTELITGPQIGTPRTSDGQSSSSFFCEQEGERKTGQWSSVAGRANKQSV